MATTCTYCDRTACTVDTRGRRVCLDHVNGLRDVATRVVQRHSAELREAEQQLADAIKRAGPLAPQAPRYSPEGNATTKDFLNRLRVRARNARDADQLRGVVLGLIDLLEDTL